MSSHNRLPLVSHRVVVRARRPTRRGDFIWQIVRADTDGEIVVESGSRSFGTMEEAYAAGAVVLQRYNASVRIAFNASIFR